MTRDSTLRSTRTRRLMPCLRMRGARLTKQSGALIYRRLKTSSPVNIQPRSFMRRISSTRYQMICRASFSNKSLSPPTVSRLSLRGIARLMPYGHFLQDKYVHQFSYKFYYQASREANKFLLGSSEASVGRKLCQQSLQARITTQSYESNTSTSPRAGSRSRAGRTTRLRSK